MISATPHIEVDMMPGDANGYVLHTDCEQTPQGQHDIEEIWDNYWHELGHDNAPPLLILQGGMTLSVIEDDDGHPTT